MTLSLNDVNNSRAPLSNKNYSTVFYWIRLTKDINICHSCVSIVARVAKRCKLPIDEDIFKVLDEEILGMRATQIRISI
jgi:hypothetical protein